MGRPRNTIAGYPLEARMEVAQRLINGATYAEIREWCEGQSLKSPHDSSFAAYQRNTEFRKIKNELLTWKRRAQEKRAIAEAITAGGGPDALADLAMFEAVDALRELISGGVLTSGKDVATVATAISNLKRTLLKDAEARHREEMADKAAALKRELGDGKKAADPAAVADALDRILGVHVKMARENGEKDQAAGVSPETMKQIKQVYGIPT